MSKEEYDSLLKKLDDCLHEHEEEKLCPDEIEDDSDLAAGFTLLPGEDSPPPEYSFEPFLDELYVILKSGIFQDGQLTGRQLTGHARTYKRYRIINLEKFIWLLCDKINRFSPVYLNEDEQIFDGLSNLLDALESSRYIIKHIFGKHEETKIVTLCEKVKAWLNTNQDYLTEPSPQFGMTERLLTEQVTDLFKEHIPNAPEETIYNGVCNFLGLFDIKCNPKTLAMREYRRKRAQIES